MKPVTGTLAANNRCREGRTLCALHFHTAVQTSKIHSLTFSFWGTTIDNVFTCFQDYLCIMSPVWLRGTFIAYIFLFPDNMSSLFPRPRRSISNLGLNFPPHEIITRLYLVHWNLFVVSRHLKMLPPSPWLFNRPPLRVLFICSQNF